MAERIRVIDIVRDKKVAHRKRDLTALPPGGKKRDLEQRNYFALTKFAAKLELSEGVRRQFKHFPAEGPKPAHDHVKHLGVDIHLRDGLKPDANGEIHCLLEVKIRKVEPRNGGGKTNFYAYINAYPLPEGEKVKKVVTLAHVRRDESAYEKIVVPNDDQANTQGRIYVSALPQAVASASATA